MHIVNYVKDKSPSKICHWFIVGINYAEDLMNILIHLLVL